MVFFANFFSFLINSISTIISIYSLIVVIACLISWVNPDPYNPVVRFLRGLTEPAFYRIRKYLPFVVISGLDLSPIVLIFALQFIQNVILKTFAQYMGKILI